MNQDQAKGVAGAEGDDQEAMIGDISEEDSQQILRHLKGMNELDDNEEVDIQNLQILPGGGNATILDNLDRA